MCKINANVVVSSQEEYTGAALTLKTIKGKYKEIKQRRDDVVGPFKEALKNLDDRFKKPMALLLNVEENLKSSILAYDNAMEEKRKKEQDRLDKIAENKRLKAEERAQKQLGKGNEDKAEEIIQKAVEAPVAIAVSKMPAVAGVSKRDKWTFRIVDENLLLREYLIPDTKKLAMAARLYKKTKEIPGIEIYNDPIISSGSV